MLSEKDIAAFESAVVKSRQFFLFRLLHRPLEYLKGNGYYRFVYPLVQKPWIQHTKLFFGESIIVPLPAGLDLYLLGIKTHHSEIRLTRMLFRNLREGQVFIDVGAHVGYFSLLAARLTGQQGRVYAFEASSFIWPFLQHNVSGISSISVIHQAVGASGEMVTMKEFPVLFSEFNTISRHEPVISENKSRTYIEKMVEGITLEVFFHKHNITPDWIKIDVEGAEKDVIQGLLPFLNVGSPRIIMEFIPGPNAHMYLEAVNMLLKSDFEVYHIDDFGLLSQTNISQLKLLTSDSENLVFIKQAD